MLVLSRKQQQSVVIQDNIKVTVLSVKGSKVQLGIEAPNDVHIFRAEIAPWVEGQPAPGANQDSWTHSAAACC